MTDRKILFEKILESYMMENNLTDDEINELYSLEMDLKAINYMRSCTKLPTSKQIISDCKKRFKELNDNGKDYEYNSYIGGYLDSFAKYLIPRFK